MSSSPFSTRQPAETEVASNVDDSAFDQIVDVADPTADSDLAGRPPNKGDYFIRWELAEKGIKKAFGKKDNKPYLQMYVQGNIVAEGEEFHGYMVFVPAPIMSLLFGGKPTSDLHSFLHKIGHTVERPMSGNELKLYAEEVMAAKPMGRATLNWEASYKTTNAAGEPIYKTQRVGMENFPYNDESGEYEYIIESEKDGTPLAARCIVTKHLPAQ